MTTVVRSGASNLDLAQDVAPDRSPHVVQELERVRDENQQQQAQLAELSSEVAGLRERLTCRACSPHRLRVAEPFSIVDRLTTKDLGRHWMQLNLRSVGYVSGDLVSVIDGDDFSWDLGLGYSFGRYVALQFAYHDFGDIAIGTPAAAPLKELRDWLAAARKAVAERSTIAVVDATGVPQAEVRR